MHLAKHLRKLLFNYSSSIDRKIVWDFAVENYYLWFGIEIEIENIVKVIEYTNYSVIVTVVQN